MPRLTLSRLCWTALLAACAAGNSTAQKLLPATFRTNAQLVLVPVNVTDRDGRAVEGLRAENFKVFDDQTPREIAAFSSEDAPCSVGLVFDISGSMRDALNATKSVAQAFFKTTNPEDEFLMLTVSTLPNTVSGFTTDTVALQQNVQAATPGGFTALLDTVYLALSRMKNGTRPRRALLILSDGMDNQSRYSKGELMRLAFETDAQVYVVLVDGIPGASSGGGLYVPSMVAKPWQRAAERQGPETLEELAEKTGGLHFHARNVEEGAAAAAKIGRSLRNEYIIGYRAPVTDAPGKYHRVRIKSNVPKVRVYARNGYYAQ